MITKITKEKFKEFIDHNITIIDPDNTYIDDTVIIDEGTIIYPGVIISENVHIHKDCKIYAYAFINKNVEIFNNVNIGQYTIIRDDTKIGSYSNIGPHCEIARSILGCKCIIGHKNFIGDAVLMDEVKFGAGAIIANTNWEQRFKTFIGTKTKIAVNVTLIAPLNIGQNCFIAAGVTFKGNLEDNKFVKNNNEIIIKDNKLI